MNDPWPQAWDYGRGAWNVSQAWIIWRTANSAGITLDTQFLCGVAWDGQTEYSINVFGYFDWGRGHLNSCTVPRDNLGYQQAVTAHELGHLAGLAHTNNQLMDPSPGYVYQIFGINTPQQDDINGINALY